MFSTDLPLFAPPEKVGERRQRKANERAKPAPSFDSQNSSNSVQQEQRWKSNSRKAKNVKPDPQNSLHVEARHVDTKLAQQYKDPVMQPGCTYSATLTSNLPSGAPMSHQPSKLPELVRDSTSRRTDSHESRFSYDLRWEFRIPKNVNRLKDITAAHLLNPGSTTCGRTRASSVCTDLESFTLESRPNVESKRKLRPQTVLIEGGLSLDALRMHNAIHEGSIPSDIGRTPTNTEHEDEDEHDNPGPRFTCRPLSQWECLAPRGVPKEMHPLPQPVIPQAANARSTLLEPHFAHFIRRMEDAGPQTILDRLKDGWQEHSGAQSDEEASLERQLWLLTGLQMQFLSKTRHPPKPVCDTGRILELYGNLSEVYQLSAMHPMQTVHYLTTRPQRNMAMPSNVQYLTVRDHGSVPLPYPEEYFSHIRASTLPSLVPSSTLPGLFGECYKLLALGGLLEIRIMDAAPLRRNAGPLLRTWIEDRLSVNLERLFRCSKPCLLIPTWLKEAGFTLLDEENSSNMAVPCAFDPSSHSVDQELSAVIGQFLWRDMWGPFVADDPKEPRWWWEDPYIVEECLQHQTMLECRTIFAYKQPPPLNCD